jgi:hypothetical protein
MMPPTGGQDTGFGPTPGAMGLSNQMQNMNLHEPPKQPEMTGFGGPSNEGFTPATAMDSQITPSHDVFGQGPSAFGSEGPGGGSSYQQPS